MPSRWTLGAVRRFVAAARRATMATADPEDRPRLVPLCFVVAERTDQPAGQEERVVLYSPIDEKPKRSADPMRLARVRDLLARPRATVLVDRWHEDWRRLGWVRLDCRAELVGSAGTDTVGAGPTRAGAAETAERSRAISALRAKYPQYRTHRLEERPLIRLTCQVGAAWGDLTSGLGGERPGDLTEEDP